MEFNYLNPKQTKNFWNKVWKTRSCWSWKGTRNKAGYGLFGVNGKNMVASRISWILHNKRLIKENYFICHTCDKPPCVNPEHLFEGTAKDNMMDCVRKNRVSRAGRSWQTQCGRGHPYKEVMIYRGWRYCRQCRRIDQREYLARKQMKYQVAVNQAEPLAKELRWCIVALNKTGGYPDVVKKAKQALHLWECSHSPPSPKLKEGE